jgi:hypothetical protein
MRLVAAGLNQAALAARHNEPKLAVTTDPFDALAKLAQLRDAGVLTESEFLEKKAKLLDGI